MGRVMVFYPLSAISWWSVLLVEETWVPGEKHRNIRKWNIIHTKLRHNYSIFNYDLFIFNSKDNSGCACGFECENVFHFFLECPINEHNRNTLFLILQNYVAIDIYMILYGNENLTEAQNVDIFTSLFSRCNVHVGKISVWVFALGTK